MEKDNGRPGYQIDAEKRYANALVYAEMSEQRKLVRREATVRWKKQNPDYSRRQRLKNLYGLTTEGYEDMWTSQEGKCKICTVELQRDTTTHIDHCHTTGVVRGLLCNHCNRLLGCAKDNQQTLKNAVEYLCRFQPSDDNPGDGERRN